MKLKFDATGILIFCILISVFACNQDDLSPTTDKEICSNVADKNFEAIIPFMNSYLQGLDRNDDESLEKFEIWLNRLSCITSATIFCKSCMYSNPPQSAMLVVFDFQRQDLEMTIHVRMAEKLEVVRIFERD
jgi:hypothetical protein